MSISTWLITGASSGLGYALAEHMSLKQGDQVVLSGRTVASMEAHSGAR
jgi:short-subunit dehydrogenase